MISREALARLQSRQPEAESSRFTRLAFDMDKYLSKQGFRVKLTKAWQSRPGGVVWEV